MSTDALLRAKADGATVRRAVANILRTLDTATPAIMVAGGGWYPEALATCQGIAAGSGYELDRVVAVVAHLSSRTPWSRNVAGAAHMCATKGDRMPGILAANHGRATLALHSADPLSTLNGPKTRAFAANILGDESQVAVDVWAARVALGTDTATSLDLVLDRAGVYGALADCYRRAAVKRSVSPAVMQSITWCVARNGRAS